MNNPAARVKKACMYLDGLTIEIEFEHSEVGELLGFLLADMQPGDSGTKCVIARFCFTKNQNEWMLSQNDGEYVINQRKLNDLALPLLNASMQSFAEHNLHSISLHAALVSDNSGSILMPGAPGSGKSNACLWLNHLGMRYHSDEFVTVNRQNGSMHALTRPYTLRKDTLKRLRKLLNLPSESKQGGRRVLLTGYFGDAAWGEKLAPPESRLYRSQNTGPAGVSLGEFRLQTGFIHCPVPYIAAEAIQSSHLLTQNKEMQAWRQNRQYDRPIPRRVIEAAGIKREQFGNRKTATAVHLFREKEFDRFFAGTKSFRDYLRWIRQQSRQHAPPPSEFYKITSPKRETIEVPLVRQLFPWAVDRCKAVYRDEATEVE